MTTKPTTQIETPKTSKTPSTAKIKPILPPAEKVEPVVTAPVEEAVVEPVVAEEQPKDPTGWRAKKSRRQPQAVTVELEIPLGYRLCGTGSSLVLGYPAGEHEKAAQWLKSLQEQHPQIVNAVRAGKVSL